MFKWLWERIENKIIQSHSSEMMPWLHQLSGLADEDVAAVYLSALSIRNAMKGLVDIDLMNPVEALGKNKMLAVQLGDQVRDAPEPLRHDLANGFNVWVFTVRSVRHEELQPVVLQIWRQLCRGLPHVHRLSKEIFDQTGYQTDLTDLGQVPVGFGAALNQCR